MHFSAHPLIIHPRATDHNTEFMTSRSYSSHFPLSQSSTQTMPVCHRQLPRQQSDITPYHANIRPPIGPSAFGDFAASLLPRSVDPVMYVPASTQPRQINGPPLCDQTNTLQVMIGSVSRQPADHNHPPPDFPIKSTQLVAANRLLARILFPYTKKIYGNGNITSVRNPNTAEAH